jgi:hypothetical protein
MNDQTKEETEKEVEKSQKHEQTRSLEDDDAEHHA